MTIKDYLLDTLSPTEIQDITLHGCSGGVGGFIYYSETRAFHDKYETEIWEMLHEDQQDREEIFILGFINTLKGAQNVGSLDQLKNLLCWYAVERTCYKIF